MTIETILFSALKLIGGLCLFLFGMNVMGQGLERRAGGKLRSLLETLTTKKSAGFLTGLVVTAIIQSSSATTVMVVGFVNSGIMSLAQAINVIMGANLGTTVTGWIISMNEIDGGTSFFLKLLKPSSFTPVLALIGVIYFIFCKSTKKKDTGSILLGFATLMYGMDAMSGAMSSLADSEEFRNIFLMFENPFMGVIVGTVLTAIIQSSSASVGILQALSLSGLVSNHACIPIVMGQSIGTCVTAMLSSIGANRTAKRAAAAHLIFNLFGTVIWLAVYLVVIMFVRPAILDQDASPVSIAIINTAFKALSILIFMPVSGMIEKMTALLVPRKNSEEAVELDERLLATPSVALERCRTIAEEMAVVATQGLKDGLASLENYSEQAAKAVRDIEDKTDHYEDILGSYLVKLSTRQISDADSNEAAKLLRVIGDFERISDHGVNLLESAEEIREKKIVFSNTAKKELETLSNAVTECLDLSLKAFLEEDVEAAAMVEPLEQVIDELKEKLRSRHIIRLQQGDCTIEAGFVWSDLLTNLERTSDHCSNIAGCVRDMLHNELNLHEYLRSVRTDDADYKKNLRSYEEKYALPAFAAAEAAAE